MAVTGSDGLRVIDSTYALEECLGEGGMGAVYRARHIHLGKAFALKLIHPKMLSTTDGLRRFEVEARALGRLNHPSIVRVTDYGIDRDADSAPYLVMEYLEGETLKSFFEREGVLDPEDALVLLEAIAGGLDYAHAQGILHRDLKPHNVIVTRDRAGRPQVKIVDFGLARFMVGASERVVSQAIHDRLFETLPQEESEDEAHTMAFEPGSDSGGETPLSDSDGVTIKSGETPMVGDGYPSGRTAAGTLVGTAGYMAPEVADREGATAASDVYSFGVLTYEMLVGRRPFKGSFMALLRAHVFDAPPLPSKLNPSLSPELDEAILAALAKEPAQRPPTAGDAVSRLRDAWDRYRLARWRARELPRRLAISGVVALIAAVAVAVSGQWSLVRELEGRLVDARFSRCDPRSPGPELAIAILDDATLDADPEHRPTTGYQDEIATVLERAFDRGATGVALDLLMPEFWNESDAFVRFILSHHDRLALAVHSDDEERLFGEEVAKGLITAALGPDRAAEMFGYANLLQDRDGAVRRMRTGFRDLNQRWYPTLPARVTAIISGESRLPAESDEPIWVDYRIDWREIPTWSWKDLSTMLDSEPEALSGRFLIVGSDIEGSGDTSHPLPHPEGLPGLGPGVVVQALMAQTLIDGEPIRGQVLWVAVGAAVLVFPLLMLVLWPRQVVYGIAAVLGYVVLYVVAGFLALVWGGLLVPLAAPLVVLPLALLAAVAVRWKLPVRPQRTTSGRSS